MSTFNLPEDIFPGSDMLNDSIIIHEYHAKVGSFKGRSILNKNAISLVIKGEKTMHFAEKTVYANDKEIHFLSAGKCLASIDLSKQEMFTSILIFFGSKELTDFYIKYSDAINKKKKGGENGNEYYISIRKDGFINNFINSLQLLLRSGVKLSQEMKLLKFEEFLLYLLEVHPKALLSFSVTEKTGDDLEFRKIVETNVVNNMTLEELAFLCNTSLSTFKRRFIKIYGASPNKWIVQRRMEIAKSLLTHYDEKPSEVYYKVGYENHSSFSKSFKQVYGVTPKDFQSKKLNYQD